MLVPPLTLCLQIRGYPLQETEVCLRAAQGQPQDRLQGELQVRGPGEVPRQSGGDNAATC